MNLLKKIIKHLIIRGAIISSIFFPINRRKILFMSFLGKNYSDNPRSISDYLIKSCEGRFKIIWVYNSTDIVDDNIVFVRMGSIKYYFNLHTSMVIYWLRPNIYSFLQRKISVSILAQFNSVLKNSKGMLAARISLP
jgi:CDP-glycerol glycerophosphotransferase (TagB/SpsB family)